METGRGAPGLVVEGPEVQGVGETACHPEDVVPVPAALAHQPRLPLPHRLGVTGEKDPDRPALVRKVVGPLEVDGRDLEDPDAMPVAQVAGGGVEQAGAQRRPQDGLLRGRRIRHAQRRRRDR